MRCQRKFFDVCNTCELNSRIVGNISQSQNDLKSIWPINNHFCFTSKFGIHTRFHALRNSFCFCFCFFWFMFVLPFFSYRIVSLLSFSFHGCKAEQTPSQQPRNLLVWKCENVSFYVTRQVKTLRRTRVLAVAFIVQSICIVCIQMKSETMNPLRVWHTLTTYNRWLCRVVGSLFLYSSLILFVVFPPRTYVFLPFLFLVFGAAAALCCVLCGSTDWA